MLGLEAGVGSDQVVGEVNFYGIELADIHGGPLDVVLLDGQFYRALKVILVVHFDKSLEELLLVLRADVVDADSLTLRNVGGHRLGEFEDLAIGVGGVFDFLVGEETSTVMNDSSRLMYGASISRMSGSKTTSPFIQRTPPLAEFRMAFRRLLEVLVWSKFSLYTNDAFGTCSRIISSLKPTAMVSRSFFPNLPCRFWTCWCMMVRPSLSSVMGLGCGRASRVPIPAARITAWTFICFFLNLRAI